MEFLFKPLLYYFAGSLIAGSVLLIHGKSDWRIPPEHSKQIYERLGSTKELWLVEDAGHTDAFNTHPTEYVQRVLSFLIG